MMKETIAHWMKLLKNVPRGFYFNKPKKKCEEVQVENNEVT